MAAGSPVRSPRADAERNRQRVLDAAGRIFARRGPTATLGDVARDAGVGVGTVYRKFRDKEAVLDALFDDRIAALVRLADDAAVISDAGAAVRSLMWGVVRMRATDRGLDAILMSPARSGRFTEELSRRFVPTVERLVDRAIRAGELRPEFTAPEVCLLGYMAGKVADITGAADTGVWRRYAQLLVDGTRISAATEALTPAPLPFDEIITALGRAS